MPGRQPEGEPAPTDGSLPDSALVDIGSRPMGIYLHVPFCATRCGYCDFNTYTAEELGHGSSRTTFIDQALAELRLARTALGDRDVPVATIFVGGGTPTLLASKDLVRFVAQVREVFGILRDAEVTTEANPDSVDDRSLELLREGGFSRISFGMQSSAPHVLATLERTHTPGRSAAAAGLARAAGFDHVSVDLIYGTPGETADDFAGSLQTAVDSGADHVSAYALVVEPGTRLGARVARGDLPAPNDDVAASRYEQADTALTAAGMTWYEVSNWARPGGECRHNLGYWRGHDWWGVGPGAHSHVNGVRWWNVRHPAEYARRLAAGVSPAQAREVLDGEQRRVEDIMLRLRLREGLPLAVLRHPGVRAADEAAHRGLLDPDMLRDGLAVLTLEGRLLADAVVRDLID